MTRRFLVFSVLIFLLAQISLFADTTNLALAKSILIENDVVYLRVGEVGKNLAAEIHSAQNELALTNKIAGIILDLRFAGGDDPAAAKTAADLFAQKKLPLTILVNGETRGAAAKLAAALRAARAGLIFGASKEIKPDIAVPVKAEDEKKFFENPYATLGTFPTGDTNAVTTNNFAPFIDHTSEADLVRAKIKDGDEDGNSAPAVRPAPPQPVIRDPVLARAVDLIKGLAVVRQSRL